MAGRLQRRRGPTARCQAVLAAYAWPGNVRELENAVERAAALCEGNTIRALDLPPEMVESVQAASPEIAELDDETLIVLPGLQETPAPAPSAFNGQAHNGANGENGARANGANGIHHDAVIPLKTFLREQEQTHLNRVMDQCGGDKERAAIALGVSLATLYRKLSGEEKE